MCLGVEVFSDVLNCFLRLSACGLGFKAFKFYGGRVQDDLCNDAEVPYPLHLSFSGMTE